MKHYFLFGSPIPAVFTLDLGYMKLLSILGKVEHKDGYDIKTNTSVEVAPIPGGGNVAFAETNKEISNQNSTSNVRLSAYSVNVGRRVS